MHPDALKIHTLVHLKVGISKRVGEAGRGERQRWWPQMPPADAIRHLLRLQRAQ